MCGFGNRPPLPAQLPAAPTAPDTSSAGNKRKKRKTATNNDTILTSSSGVSTNAPTTQKTLLGS